MKREFKARKEMYERLLPRDGLHDGFMSDVDQLRVNLTWAWEHLRSAETGSWEDFKDWILSDLLGARHDCECLRLDFEMREWTRN
jgi:hypothetical protein